METHQSYCDEAWMDRNAIRQEQHTIVSSFWIEFNLQSEGVISPISYTDPLSISQLLFHTSIHSFVHYSFFHLIVIFSFFS